MLNPRLVWMLSLGGCALDATPDELRQAWLVDALFDDNRIWMARDPELLADKYRVMAADPYDFMRGSIGVYLTDLARPGTDRAPTALLTDAEAAAVLLVVDPHPENVGTLLPGEGPGPTEVDLTLAHDPRAPLLLEVNDFDGAAFGPYTIDVRRAILGLALTIEPVCDLACRGPILDRWSEAYVDELRDLEAGEPTFRAAPGLGSGGGILDRLLVKAREDGAYRKGLLASTALTAAGLRFRHADPLADGLEPLTREEGAQLDRLLEAYRQLPAAPAGFRVLDRARRFGTGVASRPAVRYVVAWDRGDPGPDDDELIEIRELVDPPLVPGLMLLPPPTFDSQPARAAEAALALWSRPDADARLAGLSDGAMAFKVLTESSFQQGFDHLDVQRDVVSGRFGSDDLGAWAELLGRQLAATHARSVTADGNPALAALRRDLGGREARFVQERTRDAEADLATALRDHRLMVAALDELGPLLGADRW